MKRYLLKIYFLSITFFVLLFGKVAAQVGVGTTSPDPSAILDLYASGNHKGVLIPRITAQEKNQINAPAKGLLVFQTDAGSGFYYFDGSDWLPLGQMTSVNGISPNTNGNVTLNVFATQTGTQADRLATVNPVDGLVHIVLGEGDETENGKIYIYSSSINAWTLTTNFNDTDTDSQNISGSSFDPLMNRLTIGIENGDPEIVDLSSLVNTDAQSINASLTNTQLVLLPENATASAVVDLGSLSNTDSQTISAAFSGTTLSLRPENTTTSVTVDLSALTSTDSQTIFASFSGTTLSLRPENTTTSVTVDLSALTSTDSQTIFASFSGTTLSLRPENTTTSVTVDLSALTSTDSQTIFADFSGTTLSLRPENTTTSVTVDLSALTSTDSQTIFAGFSGTTLSLRPENTTTSVTVDLSPLSNTDSQTLFTSLSGTILALRPENTTTTVTVDLSPLTATDTLQGVTAAGNTTSNGIVITDGNLQVYDDEEVIFGTGSERLRIYREAGPPKINRIRSGSGGDLIISDDNGNIRIQAKTGEESIYTHGDGQVELFYDNAEKMETTATGVTVSGTLVANHVSVGQNIYHTGDADTYQQFIPDDVRFVVGGIDVAKFLPNEVSVNDGSTNVDFRIESDGKANMFFVDGSSNNIGIGTATPLTDLHLFDTFPRITLEDADNTNDRSFIDQENGLLSLTARNNTGFGNIAFRRWDGTNGAYSMYIRNDGNIGIGTTAPETELEVLGTVSATRVIADTVTATNLNIATQLTFSSNASTIPPLNLNANNLNDGVGAFRVNAREADVFLNANQVAGTFSTVTFASLGDEKVAFGRNSTDDFYLTVRDGGPWRNTTFVADNSTGNISLGYDLAIAGSATVNGGTAVSSDRRLKSDILPIDAGLNKILALQPKRYIKHKTMEKKDAGRLSYGFIAQEMVSEFPALVRTANDENKTLSIDYTALIPVLTKALQEQNQTIEALRATTEDLVNMISSLESELKKLKGQLNDD